MNILSIVGVTIVVLLGIGSGVLLIRGYRNLSEGRVRSLVKWMAVAVILCGLPYAIWNLLVEAEVITFADKFLLQLPGMILVLLFFIVMFKAALVVNKIGNEFGFNEDRKRIEKELKKKK